MFALQIALLFLDDCRIKKLKSCLTSKYFVSQNCDVDPLVLGTCRESLRSSTMLILRICPSSRHLFRANFPELEHDVTTTQLAPRPLFGTKTPHSPSPITITITIPAKTKPAQPKPQLKPLTPLTFFHAAMSAPREGRQSPPPEMQSGKQLHDPPSKGKAHAAPSADYSKEKSERAKESVLSSNPEGPLDRYAKLKTCKPGERSMDGL